MDNKENEKKIIEKKSMIFEREGDWIFPNSGSMIRYWEIFTEIIIEIKDRMEIRNLFKNFK